MISGCFGRVRLFSRSGLLAAIAGLACFPPWATAQDRPARRYALVVGVREYRPQQDLPKLEYTEADAKQLAEVLKKAGYQVTLMTQKAAEGEGRRRFQPNSDFIRDEFEALVGTPSLGENDCLLVALAGHGVQFDSKVAKDKSTFFFCPADADIREVKHAEDVRERNNLLFVDDLYSTLKKSKAGVKLLLVDACRIDPSRPAAFRASSSITMPKIPPPPGGMAAFFSCSARQKAFEDSDLKHGVFFNYVIKALDGAADVNAKDGVVTIAELQSFVSRRVYDYVRNKYGARQLPHFMGELRGLAGIANVRFRIAAPRLSEKLTTEHEFGFVVSAEDGPCEGLSVSLPFPTQWPEQSVTVIREEKSPLVAKLVYRDLVTAKQLHAEIPTLPKGSQARVMVRVQLQRSTPLPPLDREKLVIPRRPPRALRTFLLASPHIETTHPDIRDTAMQVTAGRRSAWQKAAAIYGWVRENVKPASGGLKGAAAALMSRRGDIEDRAALMIALLRANRVPARFVWVPGSCYLEFYLEDDKGIGHWIPCDAAGRLVFGQMPDFRKLPILQKGDNFRLPDQPTKRSFYVSERLTVKGASAPKVTFICKAAK